MEAAYSPQSWPYVLIAVLAGLLILYGLIELHYFLRMCLCVLLARCWKKCCHILATTTVKGVCLSNDIDTLLCHMNNARYLRELDFARVDFYERTQLYRTICRKGGSVYQGSATIRYRRFIRPFHRFNIDSRIIYWDINSLYMEHRFIRPSDGFVHAIAICRQRLCDCSAEDVMAELLSRPTNVVPKYLSMANTSTPMMKLTTRTPLSPIDNCSTTHLQASQHSILSIAPTQTTMESLATPISSKTMDNGNVDNNDVVQDVDENGHVLPNKTTKTMAVLVKPEIPAELLKWIEYNDLSSKNLRN